MATILDFRCHVTVRVTKLLGVRLGSESVSGISGKIRVKVGVLFRL